VAPFVNKSLADVAAGRLACRLGAENFSLFDLTVAAVGTEIVGE
jgi:hypothetical protein